MEKELTSEQKELIRGGDITELLRASSESAFNKIHTVINEQIDLLPSIVVELGAHNEHLRDFEEESGNEKYIELLHTMVDFVKMDVWKKIDDLKREMLENVVAVDLK
tara:strand:- start:97 stop:417 length:321 start_codon:yes stop_codon:yes gene_type:complete